jgi:hypothetical protein
MMISASDSPGHTDTAWRRGASEALLAILAASNMEVLGLLRPQYHLYNPRTLFKTSVCEVVGQLLTVLRKRPRALI